MVRIVYSNLHSTMKQVVQTRLEDSRLQKRLSGAVPECI